MLVRSCKLVLNAEWPVYHFTIGFGNTESEWIMGSYTKYFPNENLSLALLSIAVVQGAWFAFYSVPIRKCYGCFVYKK